MHILVSASAIDQNEFENIGISDIDENPIYRISDKNTDIGILPTPLSDTFSEVNSSRSIEQTKSQEIVSVMASIQQ